MRIFVFGSNMAGRHGAGAALAALKFHGAIFGKGEGLAGNSYALPTKGWHVEMLTFEEVLPGIERFKKFARDNPKLTFQLTRVGCGRAGFTDAEIAPTFDDAPTNVLMPEEWRPYLTRDFQYWGAFSD